MKLLELFKINGIYLKINGSYFYINGIYMDLLYFKVENKWGLFLHKR